ncbi:MAG: ABC transporter ATP-binding protein [Flavobacteriales bacterium]|nr:ABC transporter ATP-binding protein [Flavobacteriales bacterium]MBP9078684.1 ABC transporter ATP-binding protein [Flavobacteriales bacterium]
MARVIFENTGKLYGSMWALRELNARFEPGETVSVIGPNGSGKTTLIKCLLGLVHPTTGTIHVNGHKVGPDPTYRHHVGHMPQISRFPNELMIGQLIDLMDDIRGSDMARDEGPLVKQLGVDAMMNKRLGTLSGGQRQKVSAVLAFRYAPSVLVLDEPTAGLDPLSAELLLAAVRDIKRTGCTVLITSHLMEEVEALADRVAYLHEGRLQFLLTPEEIVGATGHQRLSKAIPAMLIRDPRPHVESL